VTWRQRLFPEHVERRAREMTGIEQFDQIGIDDDITACDVDEVRAVRQF